VNSEIGCECVQVLVKVEV